ncbi:SWIM zinc finger family protein [Massilia sp. CFBP 13647]
MDCSCRRKYPCHHAIAVKGVWPSRRDCSHPGKQQVSQAP